VITSSLDRLTISVQETFQSTVQGEGLLAGSLVDFIRLYGCPVRCPWCDTGYADGGTTLPHRTVSVAALLAELRSPRVVISGGEPFIHPQLGALCAAILATGRQVSIETSGSFWQPVPEPVWVTLSPKEHVNPRFPVRPECWARANEVKIVISDGSEPAFYRAHLRPGVTVSLQPEWEERHRTLPLALELLRNHPEYRLSVQLHKYIEVP